MWSVFLRKIATQDNLQKRASPFLTSACYVTPILSRLIIFSLVASSPSIFGSCSVHDFPFMALSLLRLRPLSMDGKD
ncbi:hypothetical protein LINPERPRIM_LOCUS32566 [Linum perenne]